VRQQAAGGIFSCNGHAMLLALLFFEMADTTFSCGITCRSFAEAKGSRLSPHFAKGKVYLPPSAKVPICSFSFSR